MKIINKSDLAHYSMAARRTLEPGAISYDTNAHRFTESLQAVIRECGTWGCVRLNPNEKAYLNKLLELADQGDKYVPPVVKKDDPLKALVERDTKEAAAKMASIAAAKAREDAINAETTYASANDIAAAKANAANIKGDIPAKQLDSNSEEVSLKDLLGNNRFIEESMKHSHVRTSMASEAGWDMTKMNAPKVEATTESAEAKVESTESTTKSAEPATEQAAAEPVKEKKTRKRGSSK